MAVVFDLHGQNTGILLSWTLMCIVYKNINTFMRVQCALCVHIHVYVVIVCVSRMHNYMYTVD